ncbi:MAG TPA: Yip1 family protein [Spirochaetota bacterium]|mgnify:CR=1 FL=1|nr:Yip1 family protein [Spirochaetota bacterium]
MILETIKSLRWTDFFLYAITDPRELYRRIRQKDPDPFALSFIIPAVASLFDILVLSLAGKETGFFYYKMSYGWILVFIYAVFKIVIYSSLVDVTAQFFGYKGNIREMLTIANFSIFPGIFLLPVFYLFAVIDFAPGFFYVFFSILFFIWYVMIFVQGISEMHSIDFGKSFVIFILPALFIGIVVFLITVLLVITGIGFITA